MKENELGKEMEHAKLSSNNAGGEAPLPSPERQATIKAPLEDIFTCFLSCSASMIFSLLWLHSRFWILFYAWTVSEREGLGLAVNSHKYACSRDSNITREQSWPQELSNDSTTLVLSVIF